MTATLHDRCRPVQRKCPEGNGGIRVAKPITQFFLDLGYPLRNARWSWSASSNGGILLRTWADDFSSREKRVGVLGAPADYQERDSYGLDERIRHLRALWSGGVAGYTVIATAKNVDAPKREIKDYRDDKIFVIDHLEELEHGGIAAVLSTLVAVDDLEVHAATHRTAAAQGLFPVDAPQTGISTDSYKTKLPAIRAWLIDVARRRSMVTYGEVMDRFGLIFFVLRTAMSRLGHECVENKEPILTALIVDKETHRCSEGLQDEFGVEDDQAERERCYARWSETPQPVTAGGSAAEPATEPEDSLEARAARFAKVEVRTHQAGFRRAVFFSCEGKCVVSGCDVPEAVEAAHLEGRNWRAGHNSAADSVLLRRDLHALYDTGLLSFGDSGVVELHPKIVEYYGPLQGVVVDLLSPTAVQLAI